MHLGILRRQVPLLGIAGRLMTACFNICTCVLDLRSCIFNLTYLFHILLCWPDFFYICILVTCFEVET